jgi:lipopolysaccharide export system protein LptC
MASPIGKGYMDSAGQRRVRRYSQAVRWMKIALPLAALGLIAAIFLSARDKGELSDLFTVEELATLGAGLKLDNPRFAGVTAKGEAFSLRADWALPDSAMPRIIDLERPEGEIEMADGLIVSASAATGRMYRKRELLVLEGSVVLDDSDGYHIETGRLELDLDSKTAFAPGRIVGTGPRGRIEAGSMRAVAGKQQGRDGDEGGKIWFENRVRLVFIPDVDQK